MFLKIEDKRGVSLASTFRGGVPLKVFLFLCGAADRSGSSFFTTHSHASLLPSKEVEELGCQAALPLNRSPPANCHFVDPQWPVPFSPSPEETRRDVDGGRLPFAKKLGQVRQAALSLLNTGTMAHR